VGSSSSTKRRRSVVGYRESAQEKEAVEVAELDAEKERKEEVVRKKRKKVGGERTLKIIPLVYYPGKEKTREYHQQQRRGREEGSC